MKITHKMTMADKLREVLWVKKWKQKELAAKLGVSEKTVSFWVNGKKQPTGYRFDEINKMYSDVTGDEVGKNVSEIIRDYQAGDGLDESEKVFTIDEKIYYEAKCLVLAKEKDNHRYVYLYPSVGGEKDGWYKVGGRSLLFYKNLLASRLGREAKIRDDTDKVHRFYNGIASVRWGDKLMIEAEGLGYKASRIEYDVIVIDLKRDYSDAEIKTMMGVIRAERDRVKKMVRPKANYPEIMMAMNKLIQVLPSKVKKLDKSYREVWGKELLEPMTEMLKIYFRFANGRMEKRDAKLEILERTDDLMAMIYMMDESGMLDITARTRLGENVIAIRKEVEERL